MRLAYELFPKLREIDFRSWRNSGYEWQEHRCYKLDGSNLEINGKKWDLTDPGIDLDEIQKEIDFLYDRHGIYTNDEELDEDHEKFEKRNTSLWPAIILILFNIGIITFIIRI